MPYLFLQLGGSRRPGKKWRPDGWGVGPVLQPLADTESFELHRKDGFSTLLLLGKRSAGVTGSRSMAPAVNWDQNCH